MIVYTYYIYIYWYSYIYIFIFMAILVKQDLRFDSKGESIRTPSCDHSI